MWLSRRQPHVLLMANQNLVGKTGQRSGTTSRSPTEQTKGLTTSPMHCFLTNICRRFDIRFIGHKVGGRPPA